jgi:hypothetical protein
VKRRLPSCMFFVQTQSNDFPNVVVYALSPPSSCIRILQSKSFGTHPNCTNLSALVLSPQPHMMLFLSALKAYIESGRRDDVLRDRGFG